MIELQRQITRRLPQGIVAEIGPEGVSLRRFRGRKRHTVTWEQIASLTGTSSSEALLWATEQALGSRHIQSMGGSAVAGGGRKMDAFRSDRMPRR